MTGLKLEELLSFLGDTFDSLASCVENRELRRDSTDYHSGDLFTLSITFEILDHLSFLVLIVEQVL